MSWYISAAFMTFARPFWVDLVSNCFLFGKLSVDRHRKHVLRIVYCSNYRPSMTFLFSVFIFS